MKHWLNRLIQHYTYDMRIKTKLAVSHLILVLLPTAVLSIFLYLRIYNMVMEDSINGEQALFDQTVTSIENLISYAEHTCDSMIQSSMIHGLFQSSLDPSETAGYSQILIDRLDRLLELTKNHSMIQDIKIYYNDRLYQNIEPFSQETPSWLSPLSLMDSPWIGSFAQNAKDRLVCPEDCLSSLESQKNGTLAYIARIPVLSGGETEETGKSQTAGFLVLYLARSSFDTLLFQNVSVSEEITFLVNENQELVASSNYEAIPDPQVLSRLFASVKSKERGADRSQTVPSFRFSLNTAKNGSMYAAASPICGTDWIMVSLIPSFRMGEAGKDVILHFSALYLLAIVIALYTSFRLAGSIANRIIGVAFQMETVRSGRPLPIELTDSGKDEIGILADTYNYMTAEINDLMEQQEKTSEELRIAEFRALQAQINPHFLYNTLDMINWLAQNGQTERVTKAVQALSRFYKLTLGRKELLHSVEQELEHVGLYVQLQNMRYDNCADYMVDVPEELFSCPIPKLTFQPIVENAILHGIMMKEEKKGSILLTGWPEGNDMVFVISDDGAGIPPETLHALKEDVNSGASEPDLSSASPASSASSQSFSSHIGLYNTNLRLKSLYGPSYGLFFSSTEGQGTEVTLRLPINNRPNAGS